MKSNTTSLAISNKNDQKESENYSKNSSSQQ